MSLWMWVVWGVFLIAQNASFTLVSRARNSGSLGYHALAAVGSNGIWFASQMFIIANVVEIVKNSDWILGIWTGVFYTICTIVGSVGMHYFALNKIEKGNRRVGALA